MQWSDLLVIDGGGIDRQHHRFVDAINTFHDAVAHGEEAEAIAATLDYLEDYGARHFADEERLLEAAAYPKLDQHRRQHRQFLEQIALFSAQLSDGVGLGHGMAQFLGSWLVNHIMVSDKAYLGHLRNSGRLTTMDGT